jgi:hypothetical protein
MSVPPRTENDEAGWEVSGERPHRPGRRENPDKLGLAIVALVLVAVFVAVLILLL